MIFNSKKIILCLFLALVVTASIIAVSLLLKNQTSEVELEAFILKNCNVDTLYPNDVDCTTFYKCTAHGLQLFYCPSGLHFNPTTNICDWSEGLGSTTDDLATQTSSLDSTRSQTKVEDVLNSKHKNSEEDIRETTTEILEASDISAIELEEEETEDISQGIQQHITKSTSDTSDHSVFATEIDYSKVSESSSFINIFSVEVSVMESGINEESSSKQNSEETNYSPDSLMKGDVSEVQVLEETTANHLHYYASSNSEKSSNLPSTDSFVSQSAEYSQYSKQIDVSSTSIIGSLLSHTSNTKNLESSTEASLDGMIFNSPNLDGGLLVQAESPMSKDTSYNLTEVFATIDPDGHATFNSFIVDTLLGIENTETTLQATDLNNTGRDISSKSTTESSPITFDTQTAVKTNEVNDVYSTEKSASTEAVFSYSKYRGANDTVEVSLLQTQTITTKYASKTTSGEITVVPTEILPSYDTISYNNNKDVTSLDIYSTEYTTESHALISGETTTGSILVSYRRSDSDSMTSAIEFTEKATLTTQSQFTTVSSLQAENDMASIADSVNLPYDKFSEFNETSILGTLNSTDSFVGTSISFTQNDINRLSPIYAQITTKNSETLSGNVLGNSFSENNDHISNNFVTLPDSKFHVVENVVKDGEEVTPSGFTISKLEMSSNKPTMSLPSIFQKTQTKLNTNNEITTEMYSTDNTLKVEGTNNFHTESQTKQNENQQTTPLDTFSLNSKASEKTVYSSMLPITSVSKETTTDVLENLKTVTAVTEGPTIPSNKIHILSSVDIETLTSVAEDLMFETQKTNMGKTAPDFNSNELVSKSSISNGIIPQTKQNSTKKINFESTTVVTPTETITIFTEPNKNNKNHFSGNATTNTQSSVTDNTTILDNNTTQGLQESSANDDDSTNETHNTTFTTTVEESLSVVNELNILLNVTDIFLSQSTLDNVKVQKLQTTNEKIDNITTDNDKKVYLTSTVEGLSHGKLDVDNNSAKNKLVTKIDITTQSQWNIDEQSKTDVSFGQTNIENITAEDLNISSDKVDIVVVQNNVSSVLNTTENNISPQVTEIYSEKNMAGISLGQNQLKNITWSAIVTENNNKQNITNTTLDQNQLDKIIVQATKATRGNISDITTKSYENVVTTVNRDILVDEKLKTYNVNENNLLVTSGSEHNNEENATASMGQSILDNITVPESNVTSDKVSGNTNENYRNVVTTLKENFSFDEKLNDSSLATESNNEQNMIHVSLHQNRLDNIAVQKVKVTSDRVSDLSTKSSENVFATVKDDEQLNTYNVSENNQSSASTKNNKEDNATNASMAQSKLDNITAQELYMASNKVGEDYQNIIATIYEDVWLDEKMKESSLVTENNNKQNVIDFSLDKNLLDTIVVQEIKVTSDELSDTATKSSKNVVTTFKDDIFVDEKFNTYNVGESNESSSSTKQNNAETVTKVSVGQNILDNITVQQINAASDKVSKNTTENHQYVITTLKGKLATENNNKQNMTNVSVDPNQLNESNQTSTSTKLNNEENTTNISIDQHTLLYISIEELKVTSDNVSSVITENQKNVNITIEQNTTGIYSNESLLENITMGEFEVKTDKFDETLQKNVSTDFKNEHNITNISPNQNVHNNVAKQELKETSANSSVKIDKILEMFSTVTPVSPSDHQNFASQSMQYTKFPNKNMNKKEEEIISVIEEIHEALETMNELVEKIEYDFDKNRGDNDDDDGGSDGKDDYDDDDDDGDNNDDDNNDDEDEDDDNEDENEDQSNRHHHKHDNRPNKNEDRDKNSKESTCNTSKRCREKRKKSNKNKYKSKHKSNDDKKTNYSDEIHAFISSPNESDPVNSGMNDKIRNDEMKRVYKDNSRQSNNYKHEDTEVFYKVIGKYRRRVYF